MEAQAAQLAETVACIRATAGGSVRQSKTCKGILFLCLGKSTGGLVRMFWFACLIPGFLASGS